METIFKTNTEVPGWLKAGMKFKGKWIADGNNICELISFCAVKNLATVRITTETSDWEEDGWNLEHTIWGFRNGDYRKL